MEGFREIGQRARASLERRERAGRRRRLAVQSGGEGLVNLADNDYWELASDPRTREAAKREIDRSGCSASASPLITGYRPAHADFLAWARQWHGFEFGMLWNSGYVANQSLLGLLPRRGDVVLMDRLIHNSLIAGALGSGARLRRYRHLDIGHLERLLEEEAAEMKPEADRAAFVATESVFSMDGDSPDLRAMAELKRRFGFFWIVDEAHALGWYGARGSGLVEEAGVAEEVDALVGTLGKALGSVGAYTLFHDADVADYLLNEAGGFVYSTYLPPSAAAAALAAGRLLEAMAGPRRAARERAAGLRRRLAEAGLEVGSGDGPVVPISVGGSEGETLAAAERLRRRGYLAGAIRPPTVPKGESRLRLSLKGSLDESDMNALAAAVVAAAEGR